MDLHRERLKSNMKKRGLTEDQKRKVDEFLDGLYLDVQGPGENKFTEEYIIKVITRFAVSLCSAWWSLRELFDYIQNRKTFKEFTHGTVS